MPIHWKFDPILVAVGPISIRWYGVLFVAAFFVGQVVLSKIFKSEGVEQGHAERLLPYSLVGTVVGARLVHCLFYDPGYYSSHPLAVFRIWEGGLASHGGAIGMVLGLWFASRSTRPRLPLLWLLDRVAIPAALGAVFVRAANFLNSEIVGVPTSAGWGVVFEAVDQLPRHPVQLYEAGTYLLICLALQLVYRRCRKNTPPGLLFGWFLVLIFSARIAMEFFKVPQAAYESGQVFSVGQYLSLPFLALGIAAIVRSKINPSEA